jgi:hypothetical protein
VGHAPPAAQVIPDSIQKEKLVTYVIGSWSKVTWGVQAHVDYISEINNRRLWNDATGGSYNDSQPSAG